MSSPRGEDPETGEPLWRKNEREEKEAFRARMEFEEQERQVRDREDEYRSELQRRLREAKEREEREREEREREAKEREAREREEWEQEAQENRPRLETLANPRPPESQPAADGAPVPAGAGEGLNRDDPFGEATSGAAAGLDRVTPWPGAAGTSEKEARSISFEGLDGATGTASAGTSVGIAQTSTNTDASADTDVDGGEDANVDNASLTMASDMADATVGIRENVDSRVESDDQEVEFG